MSIRENILAVFDKKREAVQVPEWSETIFLSTLTARRQADLATAQIKYPDAPSAVAILVFAAEDEAGALIFTADDIPALAEKSAGVVNRLAAAAVRLNTPIEEARKN